MNDRETDIGAQSVRLAATLQEVVSPIAAAAIDYPDGSRAAPPPLPGAAPVRHQRRHDGLYRGRRVGVVVPANRGLWVPPETEHAILSSGLVRLRSVYIEPKLAQRMLDECSVVHISPLLRELLITAVDIPLDRPPEERHEYIMKLILEEIRTLPTLPLYLPIPEGSVIAPVCRDIIDFPGAPHTLETCAQRTGISGRTLERHFVNETGMTFSRWRRQARIIASLPRLARGESVLEIALDLGYESPSAFAAMFRRALGVAPSAYFSETDLQTE